MKRKGLSQVLWLIIAAAVLMMVSMALTFTTQGTLGDFASNNDQNACQQTMDNQLAASAPGDSFDVPRTCLSDDGNPVTEPLRDKDAEEGYAVCVENDPATYTDGNSWKVEDDATDC